MRVLVTGAAGFIGSHLVPELERGGHVVFGVDLPDGDLREPSVAARLIDRYGPDVVVHLAAQVGRVLGEDNIAITVTNNALATARVAQACAAAGVRLVYTSTSEIYGDQGEHLCFEGGPEVLPHNLYGLTKRWGEEVARLYAPDGLQIVRPSMPYGPGLPAGRGRAALINFLWNAAHGRPLTVHRGGRRSWCWVGDSVRGFRMVIESGDVARTPEDSADGWGVYNLGRDDNDTAMVDVARMACDVVGASHELVVEVDPPAAQTVVKRLSMAKLYDLGWRPEVDLAEGMARTWAVIRDTYTDDGYPRAA